MMLTMVRNGQSNNLLRELAHCPSIFGISYSNLMIVCFAAMQQALILNDEKNDGRYNSAFADRAAT